MYSFAILRLAYIWSFKLLGVTHRGLLLNSIRASSSGVWVAEMTVGGWPPVADMIVVEYLAQC